MKHLITCISYSHKITEYFNRLSLYVLQILQIKPSFKKKTLRNKKPHMKVKIAQFIS